MNILKHTYIQVLVAIILGVVFGIISPSIAQEAKPLGDAFIKLIKMCVGPIIFCTIVNGFINESDIKIGRVGFKAIIYFEIVTSLALIIGLVVALLLKPGSLMNIEISSLDSQAIKDYSQNETSFTQYIINIIPKTLLHAFVDGEILPILFVALIFAIALNHIKEQVPNVIKSIDEFGIVVFKIISYVVKLSPVGAFGAMSYTVGKYGITSLFPLAKLMLCFYVTCILFIIIVFGLILKACNSSLLSLLKHIKEEIFIVLGTSSSETVLPQIIKKMENFGCKKSIVGFVIPAGYSLNLDGTCIYFTMAIIFLSQALNIDLSIWQILQIILILLVTSKGSAGVVGSAFITLAATLSIFPTIPVSSLVLILGVDRFMSEARSITNLIGNATACVAIAKLENSFKERKYEHI